MVGALRQIPVDQALRPDATKRFLNLFACRTERASSSAPSAEVNSRLTIRSTTTARIRSRSLIDVRSTCPSSQEEHSRRVTLLSAYQGDVIIEVQHPNALPPMPSGVHPCVPGRSPPTPRQRA